MRLLNLILTLLLWAMVLFIVGIVVAFLFDRGAFPFIGFLLLIGLVLFIPASIFFSMGNRRRRAFAILGYIEQAVRLNLPLSRMLTAAQRSESGATAHRLRELRSAIESGTPIGVALEYAVPEVPERIVALVWAGERLGQLPQALGRILQQEASRARRQLSDIPFYRAYPAVMVCAIAGLLWMMAIFVLPKYEQIFRDFGVALPPITKFVFFNLELFTPLLLIPAAIYLLWGIFTTLADAFRAFRIRFGPFRALVDGVLWAMPISHTMQRDGGLADALALMAEATRAGVPFDHALLEAGELRINWVLRERFRRWRKHLHGGASIGDGARAAWMPALLVGMISTVRANDDASAVLDFLARYYASRFSRVEALVRGAAIPLIVLFFAVIVATIALSLLAPMTALLPAITPQSSVF